MVRKTSDEDAKRKQDEMVQAALRRISRRLYQAQQNRRADEHTGYQDFLIGCRADVAGSYEAPTQIKRTAA